MKRRLCLILCVAICFGLVNLDRLSASAVSFVYDMSYFLFSDAGVSGDRHPEYAGDKDAQTAWSTVDAQKPGMKFVVDMMQAQEVGKIILRQPADSYPAKFNVYATKYKEDWGEPVLADQSGSASETTSISFDTEINTRFIMIELVDGTEVNENPWEISEIEILSIADSSKEVKETETSSSRDQIENQEAVAGKISLLNTMEINITEAEDPVSKAVFLEWLLRLSDQYRNINSGEYTEQSFTDIYKSSPYYNMVEYAKSVGILNAGGQFLPSDNISPNEAVEMAVNILGYGIYVKYGSDYLTQASQLGVSAGLNMSAAELTQPEAVKLFFNMLEVPLLEMSIYGSGFAVDNTEKNYAGYVWRRIYKVRGILNTNDRTNLTGNAPLLSGKVRVEDTIYNAGETGAENFLGYNVEMYVQDTDGMDDDKILVIYGFRNDVLEIPAPNLTKTEGNTINYLRKSMDAREKKAVLRDNFNMVYNEVVMIPTDIGKLNIKSGKVTLIDNNNDGEYDFVSVKEYINYYVSYLNQTDQVIYDEYTYPALTLGIKNDALKSVSYYKDGEGAAFSAIKAGFVASVAADKTVIDEKGLVTVDTEHAEVYSVYLSDKKVSGTMTSINKTDNVIEIDGRKYPISQTFSDLCEAGIASLPALGTNITACLDYFGELAGLETFAADGYEYGYLTRIYFDEELEEIAVKMFYQNGEMGTKYFAEKVTIDGSRYTADEKFIDLHMFYVADAGEPNGYKFDPQLIMYKQNAEGKITNVDSKTYDSQHETKDSIKFYKKSRYAFNTYRNMLFPDNENDTNPNFVTNSMLIFVAPATESYQGNKDYYRVYDKGYLQHDQYYDMEVYQKSDFNEAKVVVIYRDVGGSGGGSSVSGSSNLVMVDDVTYALDPEDEPKYRLTGTNGRSDLVMYFKDEAVLTRAGLLVDGKVTLNRGDVVQLTDTSGSEILSISRLYDVKNLNIELSRGGKYYQASRTTVGQVYDASGNLMMISSQYLANDDNAAAFSEVYPIPSGVVFDQADDKVRKATADDIKSYKKLRDVANTSIVIINTEWGDVKWCIIYNLENYVPVVAGEKK